MRQWLLLVLQAALQRWLKARGCARCGTPVVVHADEAGKRVLCASCLSSLEQDDGARQKLLREHRFQVSIVKDAIRELRVEDEGCGAVTAMPHSDGELVERLRAAGAGHPLSILPRPPCILCEAADEIEKLRKQNGKNQDCGGAEAAYRGVA